jgi:hypothetical protein
MARLGGNLFAGVDYPIAFGDRFLSVRLDAVTGAPLIDVYRWDRELDRLVVEVFQGRPLPGAPPITVAPSGGRGAFRLGVADDDVIGYLAGGDDSRSILISEDRISLLRGDTKSFEMLASAIRGFPIGLRVADDGEVAIGASLPPAFPTKRLFVGANVVLTDLVGLPPLIERTDFRDCRLIGPTVVTSLGNLTIRNSTLPPHEEFLWELPVASGVVVGVIGLRDCDIDGCALEGVALAVGPGRRSEMMRGLPER